MTPIIEYLKYFLKDYAIQFNGSFSRYKKNVIKCYWCRANNFGDWLTPEILSYYGFTPVFASASDAEIISVGSIMEQIPQLYGGKIIGTGFIDNNVLSFPNAEIIGVRGHNSAKNIGCTPSSVLLGDPGLLINKILYSKNIRKQGKYDLGIVPHVSDINHSFIKSLRLKNVLIIDPRDSPVAVAQKISKCKNILSSSLHGLIFSDSLGIPNRRVVISGRLKGGDFKFNDYYSCFSLSEEPLYSSAIEDYTLEKLVASCTMKDQVKIEMMISNLDKYFKGLSK